MESAVRRPFSGLIAFLAPRSTPITVTEPQPQSYPEQLSQMIKEQKRVNDLVGICERDENGSLSTRWVKACSL